MKKFKSFKDFVKEDRGIEVPEIEEEIIEEEEEVKTVDDGIKEFRKIAHESAVEDLEEQKEQNIPVPVVVTAEQVKRNNRILIVDQINEVLKHRDPILEKMTFQEWVKDPFNKIIVGLSEYHAQRLYEQDMDRADKVQAAGRASGGGVRKRKVVAAEAVTYYWTPDLMPSCSLWLDADDASTLTVASGTVSQWNNKANYRTVGLFNYVQSNGSKQPTYATASAGYNNRAVVYFDGADGMDGSGSAAVPTPLTSSTNANGKTFTVFFVADYTSRDNGDTVLAIGYHNTTYNSAEPYTNNLLLYHNSGHWFNGWGVVGTNGDALTSPSILATIQDDTGVQNIYITGTLNNTGTGENDITSEHSDYAHSRLGYGRYTTGRYFHGNIAEIILYDRSLSDSERSTVETYLQNKWDITVATQSVDPVLGSDNSYTP